jgi:mRNA interferase MazF
MPNSSRNDVLLVHYPFTDLSVTKVRPAVVIHAPHASLDILIVPLTSQTISLASGEFVLGDWQ